MLEPPRAGAPSRVVHNGDGLAYLRAARDDRGGLDASWAIVTSLPDVSELGLDLEGWSRWFGDAARLACEAVAPRSVAVFFQTDIKSEGRWVDKSFLVQRAAHDAGARLLFHKIVCRARPGAVTFARPAYSHLLAFSRELGLEPSQSSADVLPEPGHMPWARAMGVAACDAVCRFLSRHTACRTVLDPFCGLGTMLAVANRHGLDAVGVELSAKRARKAAALTLDDLGEARLARPPDVHPEDADD